MKKKREPDPPEKGYRRVLRRLVTIVPLLCVVAAVLLAAYMSGYGRPIGRIMAREEIKYYVKETYGEKVYKVGAVKYDYRNGTFFSVITNRKNKSEKYVVTERPGRVFEVAPLEEG